MTFVLLSHDWCVETGGLFRIGLVAFEIHFSPAAPQVL